MSITFRTTLLSWMATIVTLLTFVMVMIPVQKKALYENLLSKAHGVVVSLRDIGSSSVMNEDYGAVVDHCLQMIQGDPAIDYLVITRNDGFSLVHERNGWRQKEKLPENWHPQNRLASSGIDVVPLFQRRVFHYEYPFDYSGIQWGWIHVGLSLDSYDRSVATVYSRTGVMAVFFIMLSFLASVYYAKRLVKPILKLQGVVRSIAEGDLSARASIEGGNELASLAVSVNAMTDALLKRDKSLHGVRFAAQRFLTTMDWAGVISEVLEMIGEGASVSCVFVRENHLDKEKRLLCMHRYGWTRAYGGPEIVNPLPQTLAWYGSGYDRWADCFALGEMILSKARDLDGSERALLEARGVKSCIVSPIKVDDAWWGILGLEDCANEREWTEAEKDSLRSIADMLGAAIGRQRAQEALLHAKEAAETANKAKSQFLANMSHELRTPLNHIIGFTDLVVGKHFGDLNASQERYLKDVLTSSHHLLSLVNDVLDLSKVEAGKLELTLSSVDLEHLLKGSVLMVKEKSLKHGLTLTIVIGESPIYIQADERKLKQVVYNLLSNAVKFTPDGGRIELSAHWIPDASALPFALESGSNAPWIKICVKDTGIGLKKEDLTRIFNPFEQVESAANRRYQGTGLGLALVRNLVALHGGKVWAESEGENRGAVVSFAIPAILPAEGEIKSEDLQ